MAESPPATAHVNDPQVTPDIRAAGNKVGGAQVAQRPPLPLPRSEISHRRSQIIPYQDVLLR